MTQEEFDRFHNTIMTCSLFLDMSRDAVRDTEIIRSGSLLHTENCTELSSDYLYIVLEGSIKIEKISSDGRSINMLAVLPGSAANAASVLCHGKDLSKLSAEKNSTFLTADEQSIRRSIEYGGVFAVNYMEFLVNRICFLNDRISSFTGYSTESRLIHYLKEHEHDGIVIIPSSLSAFAGMLGAGRASLYRALEHMEEEGLITRNGKTIKIISAL